MPESLEQITDDDVIKAFGTDKTHRVRAPPNAVNFSKVPAQSE